MSGRKGDAGEPVPSPPAAVPCGWMSDHEVAQQVEVVGRLAVPDTRSPMGPDSTLE